MWQYLTALGLGGCASLAATWLNQSNADSTEGSLSRGTLSRGYFVWKYFASEMQQYSVCSLQVMSELMIVYELHKSTITAHQCCDYQD